MDNQGGWAPRPGPMVLNGGAAPPQQRPASAGTRLRQKPSGTAPPHQDIFASLGLDASRNRVNYGPSHPTGNATGLSTASSAAPPTTASTLFQYAPRQTVSSRFTSTTTTTTNRFMAPANRTMANTTTATSSMGFGFNRPPPMAVSTAPPTAPLATPLVAPPPVAPPMAPPVAPSVAPPIAPLMTPPITAPSAPATASTSTLSRPKPTQFFAMEDDTFDGDDGWGCDSPSTVFSNPMDDADESAVNADDDEFAWVDEEPIKSSKPVEEPVTNVATQSSVATPPSPARPMFGDTSAPPTSSFAAPPSPARSAFGESSAPPTSAFSPPPAAGSSAFGHSFHAPSYQTQEHGPSQNEQDEAEAWSDNWDEKPAAPPVVAPVSSVVHESSSTYAEQHSTAGSFVAESATASSNDFWGAQDDDALFDQGDEQWGESTGVEASLDKLTFGEQPADHNAGMVPSHALNTSFDHSHDFQPEVASAASSEHNTSFGSSSLNTSAVFASSVSSYTSNVETVEQAHAPSVTKDEPVDHSQSSFQEEQTPADAVFASSSQGSMFNQPSVEKEFESSHPHDSYGSESHSFTQDSVQHESAKEADLKWDDQSGTEDAAWNAPETHHFASTTGDDQPVKPHTKHSKEYSSTEPDSQHLYGGESTDGSFFNSPDGGNDADDTFSFEHSASFTNTRHTGGSVVSFGGVSSAAATFGGSEHASDDLYSDGNASETRSLFGSSNASTAFGTDFPSVSEGQFSVAGTVFEGSDASDDGPFSDGNGSETRSMFGSSTASTAFAQAGSVVNDHALDEPSAFGSTSSTRSELDSDIPAASSIFGASDSMDADASQFGAPPSNDQDEDIPAAASLFGATTGSDVPNPFSSFGAPPNSGPSGFPERNIPTANAADLFGSAPSGGDFNGAFGQTTQQYGESSYNSYQQVCASAEIAD